MSKSKKEIGAINPFGQFGSDESPPEEHASTDIPTSQHTDKSVSKSTAKQVNKHTDIQVSQHDDIQVKLHRATFYVSDEDDDKLERIRLARRRKGQKNDKSALIREAIALLKEE